MPDEIADTMQTNGVELDEITYNKCTLKIREVGGAFVEVCVCAVCARECVRVCACMCVCACVRAVLPFVPHPPALYVRIT